MVTAKPGKQSAKIATPAVSPNPPSQSITATIPSMWRGYVIWLLVAGLFLYPILAWGGGFIIFGICFGFLIAYIFRPLMQWQCDRGVPRLLAALVCLIIIGALMFYAVFTIGPLLRNATLAISQNLPQSFASLDELVRQLGVGALQRFAFILPADLQTTWLNHIANFQVSELLSYYLNLLVTENVWSKGTWLLSYFGNLKDLFFSLVLGIITIIYFLPRIDGLGEKLIALLPRAWHQESRYFLRMLDIRIGGYIRGLGVMIPILMVLYSGGNHYLGLQYGITMGVIQGLSHLVPILGPFIASGGALVLAFNQAGLSALVWQVGLVLSAVIALENFVLTPLILGEASGVNFYLVIVAVFIGTHAFGILGALLAVPLTALLLLIGQFARRQVSP